MTWALIASSPSPLVGGRARRCSTAGGWRAARPASAGHRLLRRSRSRWRSLSSTAACCTPPTVAPPRLARRRVPGRDRPALRRGRRLLDRLPGRRRAAARLPRFARRYFALLNLFGWSMLLVPLAGDFGTLWVAVELTTIVSALMVAIDRTDAALEASWKYVLIASSGLGIALLAIIVLYATGTHALGDAYVPRFDQPARRTPAASPTTRCGSRSCSRSSASAPRSASSPCTPGCPTPTARRRRRSRRCSRARCSPAAFYAILRFFQVAVAAGDRAFAEHVADRLRRRLAGRRQPLRAAPGQLQAPARLLLDRAHGRDRAGGRLRRPAGGRRGAAARHHPRLGQGPRLLRRRLAAAPL